MIADSGVSVAQMEALCTPRQAAEIKCQALWFRRADPSPYIDEILDSDPGHQWFMYCLDSVARREA